VFHSLFRSDETIPSVVLALSLSTLCFALIFVLDSVADRASVEGDERRVKIIKLIIKCMGLSIGFAWEQCFDAAVGVLSSASPLPHLTKLALAVFCALLLIPAWRWYILPMSHGSGWFFGFVVSEEWDKERIETTVAHLHHEMRRRSQETCKRFEELKVVRHLGTTYRPERAAWPGTIKMGRHQEVCREGYC